MEKSGIRPLNQKADLLAIADLIELCFSDHMDSEGREYINYLRRLAKNNVNKVQFDGLDVYPSTMSGYVWIDNNQLIGNLSMIPFLNNGRKLMLIANVAVHPEFRKQGIAKALTQQALKEAYNQKMGSVWLHVRHDNNVAFHLYESLGFLKRVLRTTWQIDAHNVMVSIHDPAFNVQRRSAKDWAYQRAWLQTTYPKDVTWNLPLRKNQLSPGFWNSFSRFFNDINIEHWSLHHNGSLLGTLTWEETARSYDLLWLAADPAAENEVIQHLIPYAIEQIGGQKPLVLNYPAGQSIQSFLDTGFTKLHTLLWMEYPIQAKTMIT
jgi:ribosomal protein S18 acetylase RimI-like enzyme